MDTWPPREQWPAGDDWRKAWRTGSRLAPAAGCMADSWCPNPYFSFLLRKMRKGMEGSWQKSKEKDKEKKKERGEVGREGKREEREEKTAPQAELLSTWRSRAFQVCVYLACPPQSHPSPAEGNDITCFSLFSLPQFFFSLLLRVTYISNLSLYKRELERLCISSWSEDWATRCQGLGPLKVSAFRYSSVAERRMQWFRLSQLGDYKCQQQGLLLFSC